MNIFHLVKNQFDFYPEIDLFYPEIDLNSKLTNMLHGYQTIAVDAFTNSHLTFCKKFLIVKSDKTL